MRKITLASIAIVLLFLSCASGPGSVQNASTYTMINNAQAAAVLTTTTPPPFEIIPDMKGWSYQLVTDKISGVDFYVYSIKAGADEMALHTSPVTWLVYVTGGNGILTLEEAGGGTKEIVYKAGDYMIFGKDVKHGWKGGTKDATVVFVTLTTAK
jgi:quercetin dioxygenase-like cupin family protein